MNIFEPVVRFIQSITNNFGLTILVCVIIEFIIVFPFKLLKRKNDQKKLKVAPKLKMLQEKYHINNLGPYRDNEDELEPEIREMDLGQRQTAMNKEVMQIYKDANYHAFTGWIPSILSIILTIIIYFGVSAACPDGPYSQNFSSIRESGFSENIFGVIIMVLNVASSIFISVFSQSRTILKNKKENKFEKKQLLPLLIGTLLSTGISVYITLNARIAILSMILLIQWLTFVQDLVKKIIKKKVATNEG